jgi:DNA-binding response OmpR family regulator
MTKPLALIVEDDTNLGQIFAKTLQAEFETEIANNGDLAIERLAVIKPAIVVLDLNLPGVQGKDILAYIRATPGLDSTRVIICSANELQAAVLQDDADVVLLKPVSPSQLRSIASRLGTV